MSILNKARKLLGKNRWEMHKALDITIQRVSRLDEAEQKLEPELVFRIVDLVREETGMSESEAIAALRPPKRGKKK